MEFIASDYPSFRAFKKKYRRELFKSCLGTLVISPGVPILFTLYGKLFGKDADFLALLGMASAVQLFFISHWVWIYHQYFKLPIKLDSTGIRAHGKQISLRDIATVEVVKYGYRGLDCPSSYITMRNHIGKPSVGFNIGEVGDLEEFLKILSSLRPEIKIARIWVWLYLNRFKQRIKLDSTCVRISRKQISLRDIATVEVVSSSHISLIDHTGKLIRGVCVKEVGDLEEFLRVLSSLKPEIKIIRK